MSGSEIRDSIYVFQDKMASDFSALKKNYFRLVVCQYVKNSICKEIERCQWGRKN